MLLKTTKYGKMIDGEANIKLTNKRYLIYNLLKKLQLVERFKKKLRWLVHFGNQKKSESCYQDMNFRLSDIDICEVLPVEYLNTFKNDLLKFQKESAKNVYVSQAEIIEYIISNLMNSKTVGIFGNVATYYLSEKSDLYELIDKVSVSITGISRTMVMILFHLELSQTTQQMVKKLVDSSQNRRMLFVKYGDKSSEYLVEGSFNHDKISLSLRDFELKIMETFLEKFSSHEMYLFKKSKIVPPHIAYYGEDDLNEKSKLLSLHGMQNLPRIKSDYFCTFYDMLYKPSFKSKLYCKQTVVYDLANLTNETRKRWFSYNKELSQMLSIIMTMQAMNQLTEKYFYESQRKAYSALSDKKMTLTKILKIKNEILSSTYFFRRYASEPSLLEYEALIDDYSRKFGDNDARESTFGVRYAFSKLQDNYKEKIKIIQSTLELFDDRMDLVEISFNRVIIAATLTFTMLTFVITIIFNIFKL